MDFITEFFIYHFIQFLQLVGLALCLTDSFLWCMVFSILGSTLLIVGLMSCVTGVLVRKLLTVYILTYTSFFLYSF